LRTMGPCRCTNASNAASSCRWAKRSTSCSSGCPGRLRRSARRRMCRTTCLSGPSAIRLTLPRRLPLILPRTGDLLSTSLRIAQTRHARKTSPRPALGPAPKDAERLGVHRGAYASNGLDGGPGRDLLIAGGADEASCNADILAGGGGEDMLICVPP